MPSAIPEPERARLRRLHEYHILERERVAGFDGLVGLAAQVCNTPIALITFVDEVSVWWNACVGMPAGETPREGSFCDRAIADPKGVLQVTNVSEEKRFAANPWVTGPLAARFYAGTPLATPDGDCLGTLCVLDRVPRELTAEQVKALQTLAAQAMTQLELRRQVYSLRNLEEERKEEEKRRIQLFEEHPQPMWVYDLESLRFLAVNNAAIERYGYSREEFLGMTIKDIRPTEDVPALLESVAGVTSGPCRAGVWRHRTKEGKPLEVEIHSHTQLFAGRPAELVQAVDVTERLKAERALQASEENFRQTVRDAATGIVLTSLDGQIIGANAAFCEMSGYSEEELIGMGMSKLRHPEDVQVPLPHRAEGARGARRSSVSEARFLGKAGNIIWSRVSVSAMEDEKGEPFRIINVIEDVTALRASSVRLAESQALLRIAGQVAKLGGWSAIVPEMKVRWSDEVASIHDEPAGFGPELETWIAYYAEEYQDAIRQAMVACARAGKPFDMEGRLTTAKGRKVWVRVIGEAIRDEKGEITLLQGALQDITAQKLAERTLKETRHRIWQLADAMPFIVWTATAEGEVNYSNRRFFEYTGVPEEAPPASRWQPCVHEDDLERVMALWSDCVRKRASFDIEYRLKGADGEYRWFRVQATPEHDEEGRCAGWFGTGIDVHELKLLELAARIAAQRLTITLESITDAFFTVNQAGHFTYVNAETERLLQKSRTELLGGLIWELFPEAVGTAFQKEYRRATETGEKAHFEAYYPPLGKWFDVRVYPSEEGLAVYFHDSTERRMADQQLRLLQACVARLNDGVIVTDADVIDGSGPRIVYVNEAIETRMGYKRGELLGQTPRIFQGARTDRAALDRIRAALVERRAVREELINYTKDGEEVALELVITPVTDSDGQLTHFVAIQRDITERRRGENLLRASEERFRHLANATNDALWDWDLVTDALWWNEGFELLFGFEPGEVDSFDSWQRRVHPDECDVVASGVRLAVVRGDEYWSAEYRFLRKDGTYAYVVDRGYIVRNSEGTPIRMIGGMTDLTARKTTEEKLREQAALLDNAQDAILVRDLGNRVLYWNRRAERLYGWSAEEAVGKLVTDLKLHESAAFAVATANTLENGEWTGTLNTLSKSGEKLVMEGRWTLMRSPDGAPKSILEINTDVTAKRKLEQQFLRAQRMESIGTLAGGIAHDLNNVFGPIMLSLELLKQRCTTPDDDELIAMLEGSAQHGANMVRQVLSFSRGMVGEMQELQVKHLIGDVERIANETFLKHIQVTTNVPAILPTVMGDPTQLHQVLLNLCVNARDAMPTGGKITISAETRTFDDQYAALDGEIQAGSYILLQVEDTGEGMPPEVMEQIFDPFFTTKEIGKGTGLGLSTSLAIVKSHGGVIRAYSEVGRGTKMKVYLPAHTEARGIAAEAPKKDLPRGNGELILVVDDEPSVQHITKHTLEAFGYRVDLASDGAEAIAKVADHPQGYAVVLTDMMMPVMDGPAMIQVLRKMRPDLRIIAASGLDSNHRVSKVANLGVEDFLPKPFSAETILKAIKQALARPR
jgi:PAS domain S-box-containing protein